MSDSIEVLIDKAWRVVDRGKDETADGDIPPDVQEAIDSLEEALIRVGGHRP